MRKSYGILLILSGLSIIGVMFLSFEPYELLSYISQLSLLNILILLAIQAAILVLLALKWWIILEDKNISHYNVMLVSLTGYLVNNLTPINFAGGEPIRAHLLSKLENISSKKAFSSVFVDFFLAIIPIVFLTMSVAIISIFLYDIPVFLTGGLIIIFFLSALVFFSTVSIIWRQNLLLSSILPISIFNNFLPKLLKRFFIYNKIKILICDFSEMTIDRFSNVSIITKGIFLAFLIRGLSIARTCIIFSMLGFAIDPLTIVIVRVFVDAIALFSIIPGAVGVWEGISTLLLVVFGVPTKVAFSASFIDRVYSYWISNLIGAFALMQLGTTGVINDIYLKREDKHEF